MTDIIKESGKAMSGCFIVFIFIIVLMALISVPSSDNMEPLTHDEMVSEQFSAWNGQHKGLTEIIKQNMNDPSSYRHEQTLYRDYGSHLIVQTTFMGTNIFGGKVSNIVVAKVNISGDVLDFAFHGDQIQAQQWIDQNFKK